MAFRAQINGITVEMDTAAEVRSLLGTEDHSQPKSERAPDRKSNRKRGSERAVETPANPTALSSRDRVQRMLGLLDPKPKKALELLARGPSDSTKLRDSLGLHGKRDLVGVFLSISKRAKAVGLSYKDVILTSVVGYSDGARIFQYALTPVVQEVLSADVRQ